MKKNTNELTLTFQPLLSLNKITLNSKQILIKHNKHREDKGDIGGE